MNNLKELLKVVSTDQGPSQGYPGLAQPRRCELIDELEACLVDEERLERYLEVLQDVLRGESRYTDAGFVNDEEQFDAFCEDGLDALDDESLVRTALNPGALWALADLFCDVDFMCRDTFTKHWSSVCARSGRELLERDRLRSGRQQAHPCRPAPASVRPGGDSDGEPCASPTPTVVPGELVSESSYWAHLLHPNGHSGSAARAASPRRP